MSRVPVLRPVSALLLAALAAGCAGNPDYGPRTQLGTGIGAVAGGLIGSQIGGGTGERIAAGIAGAAIGGLIGGSIGADLDARDRELAYAAQYRALEEGRSGAPIGWRNPDSGRYGSIVPGPAYQQSGRNCREYTHTIYISGRPQTARGTACRNPDGTWTALN
jgi:surface antigen